MTVTFRLGTHHADWLAKKAFRDVPLFISSVRLQNRVTLPVALGSYAVDSGGFSEIKRHGRWTITPAEYVALIRRYVDEIGRPDFVAPMDWMCEPWVIFGRRNVDPKSPHWFHGTRDARGIPVDGPDEEFGSAVLKHQAWTVENFLSLRVLAPEVPWMPVLQGWRLADYARCADMYDAASVDLTAEPIVGLGSVCRRQATSEIAEIAGHFADLGLRLHGFGVKTDGLSEYAADLVSADSMAWSYGARHEPPLPGHETRHKNCANCPEYALAWRGRVLEAMERHANRPRLRQPSLFTAEELAHV